MARWRGMVAFRFGSVELRYGSIKLLYSSIKLRYGSPHRCSEGNVRSVECTDSPFQSATKIRVQRKSVEVKEKERENVLEILARETKLAISGYVGKKKRRRCE